MTPKLQLPILILALLGSPALADEHEKRSLALLDACDVSWSSPSDNAWGSVPLGNGDIGINFWVDTSGDFLFYVSKSDAWSEAPALLKLGRIRVRFTPNPIRSTAPFHQRLRLRKGEVVVDAGDSGEQISVRVWIDANNPAIVFESESEVPIELQVSLENWRTESRKLTDIETHTTLGGNPRIDADIVFNSKAHEVMWCHRNEVSSWDYDKSSAKHPELGLGTLSDPLLHRTFGGVICGEGLEKVGTHALKSAAPSKFNQFSVYLHTAKTTTLDEWSSELSHIRASLATEDIEQRRLLHYQWWHQFWTRSWIHIDGDEQAKAVSQGYALQRYMNACAGRGQQPIKFNGSLFTMPVLKDFPEYDLSAGVDADFRLWGPHYWWQNTRLIYWSMLASGDFDLMKPLFHIYAEMLPLVKARTRLHFQHDGALFPEVVAWYGLDFAAVPSSQRSHTTFYYQSGLEMSAMMLNYWEATGDRDFLKEVAIPFANEVLLGYWEHYKRDGRGKLVISPAQSLETYWDVENPTPDIAGLKSVTRSLLAVDDEFSTAADRSFWQQASDAIPDIPTRFVDGVEVISPAATINDPKRHNWEDPQLYAIFPYRQFGLGEDGLELARRTYERRIEKRTGGWFPPAVNAALLGLADEAARIVHTNFTVENAIQIGYAELHDEYRFPGFLGPNCNWVPDQDQPSLAAIALQRMILQETDDEIILFGAWPERWNVFFRLHAKHGLRVTGEYDQGRVNVAVDPNVDPADVTVRIGEAQKAN